MRRKKVSGTITYKIVPDTFPIQTILLLCGLLLVFSAAAQEQSIRPGINRHFEDPDWQRWVSTFERPGREVYDQRHAIVTASKVRPGMTVADR